MASGSSSTSSTNPFPGISEAESAQLSAARLEPADLPSLKVTELKALLGQPPSNSLLQIREAASLRLGETLDRPFHGDVRQVFARLSQEQRGNTSLSHQTRRPPRAALGQPGTTTWQTSLTESGDTVDFRKRLKAATAVAHLLRLSVSASSFECDILAARDKGREDAWFAVFANNLARRFDAKGMSHALATWRRWKKWHEAQTVLISNREY